MNLMAITEEEGLHELHESIRIAEKQTNGKFVVFVRLVAISDT
jgi:hypothetical protein